MFPCTTSASAVEVHRSWPQNVNGAPNNVFKDLIVRSGLSPLITTSYKFISKSIVSTFAERWQPETNTFHMPFYEMVVDLMSSQLSVSTNDVHDELASVRVTSMRLDCWSG